MRRIGGQFNSSNEDKAGNHTSVVHCRSCCRGLLLSTYCRNERAFRKAGQGEMKPGQKYQAKLFFVWRRLMLRSTPAMKKALISARPAHPCLTRPPAAGFKDGYNEIVREGGGHGRQAVDGMMDFGVHRLRQGERFHDILHKETAWLLLNGTAKVALGATRAQVARQSLLDEGPSVLHGAPGEEIVIEALSGGCEWIVIRTSNTRMKGTRFYPHDDFTSEVRGVGLAQGACRRLVRTVFDYSTRSDSNLVLGEVVNLPGRWSSYPPHHHPQPEIYHYRFGPVQGYGHAELSEDVLKVREGDTVVIPGGLDHGQVAAPGYAMYYLWVVRHLPRRPYKGFVVSADHRWVLDPSRQGWEADGLTDDRPAGPLPTGERPRRSPRS